MLTALIALTVAAVEPTPPRGAVVILYDDLGFGDLGCYGHARITTPRIDALAAQACASIAAMSRSRCARPAARDS